MAAATDPWLWSVDDVVQYLCYSRERWTAGLPNVRLPEPRWFEFVLREQEVDGFTLLTNINTQFLQEVLGMKAVGRRAPIVWAIEQLQRASSGYARGQPPGRYHITDYGSSSSARATPSLGQINNLPWVDETLQPSAHRVGRIESLGTISVMPDPAPRTPDAVAKTLEPSSNLRTGSAAHRAGEEIKIDESGRKRRRLTLLKPHSLDTSKKPQGDDRTELIGFKERNLTGYLPPNGLAIDRIFFGEVQDGPSNVEEDGSSEDIQDFSSDHNKTVYEGTAQYVSRRMRHFHKLMKAAELQWGDDKESYVVQPCPSHLLKKKDSLSSIVFQTAGEEVSVLRKDLKGQARVAVGREQSSEDWNFLSHWESKDTKELPIYGESESEQSISSSLAEEMDEEEKEAVHKKALLSQQEIEDIIEEHIEQKRERWRTKKLPALQKKAWTEWKKSRALTRRRNMEATCKRNMASTSRRLEKYQAEIASQKWLKTSDLRLQCAVLDESVYQTQEYSWLLNLWQSSIEPPRPVRLFTVRQPKKRKAQKPLVSDEESLSSGSEEELVAAIDNESPFIPETGVEDPTDSDVPQDVTMESSEEDHIRVSNLEDDDVTNPGLAENEIIDLTESPYVSSGEMHVDPKLPELSSDKAASHQLQVHGETSKQEARPRKKPKGRKSIIRRILYRIELSVKEDMQKFFNSLKQKSFKAEMKRALTAMKDGKDKSPGTSALKWRTVAIFASLYACWVTRSESNWTQKSNLTIGVSQETLKKDTSGESLDKFYEALKLLLKGPLRSSTDAGGDMSTSPDTDTTPWGSENEQGRKRETPHSRRKRNIRRSAATRQRQGEAARRLKDFEDSLKKYNDSRKSILRSINIFESHNGNYIDIPQHISRKVKPHQVEGVRFLWREVVQAEEGCLLSHTMGLGKTLQAITLIACIEKAAKSQEPLIQSQIPSSLRKRRYLVACPAGLVKNWVEELKRWLPPEMNESSFIMSMIGGKDTLILPAERARCIQKWHKNGGVLILGYELLRNISKMSISDKIFDDASLVIADEAHIFKNTSSKVHLMMSRFSTKCRVALTGSPLANNLLEYYTTIDWASPGYLGKEDEFKSYYKEPIEEGTFADSTKYEERRAVQRLTVLKEQLEPKVNRKENDVLKNVLKSKSEFVLTTSLTKLQHEAYKICVESFLSKNSEDPSSARMWTWMGILGLLCSHPAILLEKLRHDVNTGKTSEKRKPSSASDNWPSNGDGDSTLTKDEGNSPSAMGMDIVEERPLDLMDVSNTLRRQIETLFDSVVDIDDIHHSNNTKVLMQIIDHAESVKDRVLVFSHSLLTLDYIERTLQKRGKAYIRIDGKTRPNERQQTLKDFNVSVEQLVVLVSTRAGGLGLNMPGANRVVIFDFQFNPQWEEQAIGRAYRIGQTKPVYVYRFLCAGTFAEKLYNKNVFKTQLAFRVVDKKNVKRHATKSSDYLFEPQIPELNDLRKYQGKDLSVLDKIISNPIRNNVGISSIDDSMSLRIEEAFTLSSEDQVAINIFKQEQEKRQRAEEARQNPGARVSTNVPQNLGAKPFDSVPLSFGADNLPQNLGADSVRQNPGEGNMPQSVGNLPTYVTACSTHIGPILPAATIPPNPEFSSTAPPLVRSNGSNILPVPAAYMLPSQGATGSTGNLAPTVEASKTPEKRVFTENKAIRRSYKPSSEVSLQQNQPWSPNEVINENLETLKQRQAMKEAQRLVSPTNVSKQPPAASNIREVITGDDLQRLADPATQEPSTPNPDVELAKTPKDTQLAPVEAQGSPRKLFENSDNPFLKTFRRK